MAAYRERESRGAAEEVLHKTVDVRALCRAEFRVLLSSLGFLCTFFRKRLRARSYSPCGSDGTPTREKNVFVILIEDKKEEAQTVF